MTRRTGKSVVYNHKRHGDFQLGGRKFSFRMKPALPRSLTKEFLLVDLVNNLDQLAEARSEVLERVKERAASYDASRLQWAARDYGNPSPTAEALLHWLSSVYIMINLYTKIGRP
jgi:hypothetical protein